MLFRHFLHSLSLSALKDPCSEVTCSFGSTCIQSSDGLSAKCMCPLSCENVPKHVVCGSNGMDYQSECELNMKACATQKNIRVHHQGRCGESVQPLNSHKHSFYVIITCSSVIILPFLHCNFLQCDHRSFWLLLECNCGQCWETLLLKCKWCLFLQNIWQLYMCVCV